MFFRVIPAPEAGRRLWALRWKNFSRRQRTNSQYFSDQDPFVALVDPLLLDHRAPRRLPVPEPLVEAAGADVGVGDDNTHAALAELSPVLVRYSKQLGPEAEIAELGKHGKDVYI